MRSPWIVLALSLGGLVAAPVARPAEPGPRAGRSAKELLDQVDDLHRGRSAHGKMSMRVATENWTREMKLEFWSLGKDRSLVRILAPLKEKGTATLKADVNIWNYLPKVNRVIKVPSSMMGGAWMGSHFTNDDLVKESRMSEDYEFATTFEGVREGTEVIEITCSPRPEAAVVWGKVVVVLAKASELPLRSDYYDEDLRLARTLAFSEVRRLGGRDIPALMRIVPADKPQEATEVRYDEVEFDLPLDEGLFSLRSLQR